MSIKLDVVWHSDAGQHAVDIGATLGLRQTTMRTTWSVADTIWASDQ